MTAQNSNSSSSGKRVPLRSQFFDDHMRYTFVTCLCLMVITACAAIWGLYERVRQPSNQIFPMTTDHKLIAPIPLSEPGLSTPALLEWVVQACTKSYTFNFIDYEKAVLNASQYFTKAGYQTYRKDLIESNIVALATARKLVINVIPTSAPIILKEKLGPDGSYTWQVQLPMLMQLQNSQDSLRRNITFTLLITRVPMSENSQGVAIEVMIARQSMA